jgi:hypothetical protein
LEPWTILKTPLGRPAFSKYSANFIAAKGVCSDGFKINVLPAVIANGIIHRGTITGKLNGVIPETTPMGSWVITQLIPGETSEDSPFKTLGIEIAKSITSTPLLMLPIASSMVLPLSKAMIVAKFSISFSIIDLKRDII